MTSQWNPDQYERFARERSQPFYDLVSLISPVPGGRAVDLGCGTGAFTAELPALLEATEVVGLDNSALMLASSTKHASDSVRFEDADINQFHDARAWDVILSNAALHWLPDHAAVLPRWIESLKPDGQLAVQIPSNADHPSHVCAREAALAMANKFAGPVPRDPVDVNVLTPERYAVILDSLGLHDVHVRLQVYCHHLSSSADVVEWTKGSSLTRFQNVLSSDDFDELIRQYRERLLATIGNHSPYFFTFKRILMYGRR